MTWLSRHAQAIQAGAALATAATAILAVAGVLVQMRAADATSRAQTAREAYAAHLLAAVANPDLADPADACGLLGSAKGAAYAAYVDHLLYAAELMLEAEPDWSATFDGAIGPHAVYVCSQVAPDAYAADMAAMLATFRDQTCADLPPCPKAPA